MQRARKRGAEDEPARLGSDDQVDFLFKQRLRHFIDERFKTVRIADQRRDVAEQNARFREIGDVAYQSFQIHRFLLCGCAEQMILNYNIFFTVFQPPAAKRARMAERRLRRCFLDTPPSHSV